MKVMERNTHLYIILSSTNVLDQQGQFFCFCNTLKTTEFEVKKKDVHDISAFIFGYF